MVIAGSSIGWRPWPGAALAHRALVQHVPPGAARPRCIDGRRRSERFAPLDPGPRRGRLVDNHHVRVPINSVRLVVGDVQVIEFMPERESVIPEPAAAIAKELPHDHNWNCARFRALTCSVALTIHGGGADGGQLFDLGM